jgi:hypothetical protein
VGRYFFHIDNGLDFLDEEGTELASPDLVLPLAMKTAATMMGEDESLWKGRGLTVRVTGQTGDLIMTVELTSVVITPTDHEPI